MLHCRCEPCDVWLTNDPILTLALFKARSTVFLNIFILEGLKYMTF